MNKFIETYMGVKCEPYVPVLKEGKFLRMNFKEEDARLYETVEPEYMKGRFVLGKVYKYAIRHNVAALFQCSNRDIREQYCYHWTYYCWDCPYWWCIIEEYGGRINHEKRTIEFDSDEDQDEFYDHYGYEPDEQTPALQAMSIGRVNGIQMTIKNFADRYGGTMIKKTIKLARK